MKRESKGILFAIVAYFFYSVALLFIKLTPCSYLLIVFSRSVIGLSLFLCIFLPKEPTLWRTTNGLKLFFRSIVSISSIFCSTYGIQRLALVDAVLLENTLPIFTSLIMLVGFRRKLAKRGMLALCIGFIGVFFILKPKLELLQFASLASLSAGFLAALSLIFVHELSKTEKNSTILFYFLLFSTIASSIPLGFNPLGMPGSFTLLLLLTIGMLFLLYQSLITKAYSYASPNTICGFSYLTLAFSMIWERLFWAMPIDIYSILGSALIISAGLLIIWENLLVTQVPP